MAYFDSFWANKAACDDAERAYYEKLSGCKVKVRYARFFFAFLFPFRLLFLDFLVEGVG